MSGTLSDIFIQAELDYRNERLSAMYQPKLKPHRERHLPWPLNRATAGHHGHRHPAVS